MIEMKVEPRVYSGSRRNLEINKNLNLLIELQKKGITKKQIYEEFINITKCHRATYYRYLNFLKRKTDTIGKHYFRKIGDICYFCETESDLTTHHINFNHNDNREENILICCEKCHNRLHVVFKRYKKLIAQ